MNARVVSVHVYPVKSTAGTSVPAAQVEFAGLRHDRRWMIVNQRGEVVTARERRALLTVTATPDDEGGLTLRAAGAAGAASAATAQTLTVPRPSALPDVPVDLSRLDAATSAGDEADAWFSDLLGEPVRLVWLDDPARRPIGLAHGGTGSEPLNLADAGPLLATTVPSLARLNEWVATEQTERGELASEPLAMQRFRPSVVLDGDLAPFVEDGWQLVRIGEVDYRLGELCDRCVLTTIDPVTLDGGKEPLRTLARHRRWNGAVWFGVRLIPLTTGTVRVGDVVSWT